MKAITHALIGFVAGLAILAAIALTTSCAGKKPVVVQAPGHCIIVDKFYDCNARNNCRVHVTVKPDPECNAWNGNVLQVKK